ncbi:MAG: hypothetical protein JOY66_07570 [Acetobacteraceae bacterium]|nr:hypothetical protein [Acetobacteraceae bacterium]
MRVFGPVAAWDASGLSLLPKMRKSRAVLAVLALRAPLPVSRGQLTALLWSRRDTEQARASLRQSVHELQEALGAGARPLLQADRTHLRLRAEGLWVDAGALHAGALPLAEAAALYRPTLLEDLLGLDPAFDRWVEAERERLDQVARAQGEAALAAATDPAQGMAAAEWLLAVDAAHEPAWRALIRGWGQAGNRAAAADAFARCQAALAGRAGLAPALETVALAEAVRDGRAIPSGPDPPPTSAAPPTATGPRPPGTRVRIGVMPLRALDPQRAGGLSLGLAEEITTALAPFRWVSCVASSSLAAIAAEPREGSPAWSGLDLDFLLEGTIQHGADRVRITAQLLDMRAAGEVVWARRFDRPAEDMLALQDEIASATVAQIAPELLLREGERAVARRRPNPTSHELTLRAIPAIYRLDQAAFRAAGEMLEEALALDPGNTAAHAWLAHWHLFLLGQGWADDAEAAIRRAGLLTERAVTLDPGDARALTLAGHVRGYLDRKPLEARALHERALAINPNLALAWCLSGLAHCYLGDHDEAIRRIGQAQALSPYDPHGFFFDMALTLPHLLRHEHARAAEIGRRAVELNPIFSSSHKLYLAALGHLGLEHEAGALRAKLLELEPGFTVQGALRRAPMVRPQDREHYAAGLRRAGLPEGPPAAPPSPQPSPASGRGGVVRTALAEHAPAPSGRGPG